MAYDQRMIHTSVIYLPSANSSTHQAGAAWRGSAWEVLVSRLAHAGPELGGVLLATAAARRGQQPAAALCCCHLRDPCRIWISLHRHSMTQIRPYEPHPGTITAFSRSGIINKGTSGSSTPQRRLSPWE